MSIQITCPNCGTIAKAPDHAAGKRGKCKSCHTILQVPSAPDSIPFAINNTPPPPIPDELPFTVTTRQTTSPKPVPEPWYYGFVHGYGIAIVTFAGIIFGLAALLTIILLLLLLVGSIRGQDYSFLPGGFIGAFLFCAYVAISLIPVVFIGALIMLIADTARNIRRTKLIAEVFLRK